MNIKDRNLYIRVFVTLRVTGIPVSATLRLELHDAYKSNSKDKLTLFG